jgi:poly(3-hydroxybutyrate) depolymerase
MHDQQRFAAVLRCVARPSSMGRQTRLGWLLAMAVGAAGCSDAADTTNTADAANADDSAPADASAPGDTSADASAPGDAASSDTSAAGDTAPSDVAVPSDTGDSGLADAPAVGSSIPAHPISFAKNMPFTVDSGTTNWVYVPDAYDASHKTPITLFVWLHGCGGMSSGDVWTASPGGSKQTWITLAPGGAEGGCWNMSTDPARVLAAIADLKTHFNVKPKGVILGGYSSGGDLGYRLAFYDAGLFAGLLAENTSPFRDTGSTQAASLAAASWKFHVVHVAHLQDTTYPIAGVRKETDAMTAAGFPMKRIEVDGGHWDDAGAIENGHAVPGTAADIATYLFPNLGAGWTSP